MLPSMLPIKTGMAPTEAELKLARSHVAEAEAAVQRQRARLERLRRGGHPTDDAEELLATFEQTLRAMREHLATEQSFARDEPKPAA